MGLLGSHKARLDNPNMPGCTFYLETDPFQTVFLHCLSEGLDVNSDIKGIIRTKSPTVLPYSLRQLKIFAQRVLGHSGPLEVDL